MATKDRRFLRFGITRQRQVFGSSFLPLLAGAAVVMSGADWWVVFVPVPLAAVLTVRAFQTRLSIVGDRFVVHRMRSPLSIPLAEVVAVGFAHGSLHMVRPLVLRTRDGRIVRVWAVSHSRRFLELPTDGKTRGERRVDEFLKAAGIHLTVERNVDQLNCRDS